MGRVKSTIQKARAKCNNKPDPRTIRGNTRYHNQEGHNRSLGAAPSHNPPPANPQPHSFAQVVPDFPIAAIYPPLRPHPATVSRVGTFNQRTESREQFEPRGHHGMAKGQPETLGPWESRDGEGKKERAYKHSIHVRQLPNAITYTRR